MSLKVRSNKAGEAVVGANELHQGEIGQIVAVADHVNACGSYADCFLLRCGEYDAEGAVVFGPTGPRMVGRDTLHLYRAVIMPRGFELTLEVI